MPYKDPADQRAAAHRHYLANAEIMKARAEVHRQQHRRNVRELIRETKAHPCLDCGIQYPYYVMQFDHRDANEKSFTLGRVSTLGKSLAKVAAEIAKCDVVCANCHAERTHQRRVARAGFEPSDL